MLYADLLILCLIDHQSQSHWKVEAISNPAALKLSAVANENAQMKWKNKKAKHIEITITLMVNI